MNSKGMRIVVAELVTLAAVVGAVAFSWAQAPPVPKGGMPSFESLATGLKATPGCLGIESARTPDGKNLIFAWFKDKDAVRAWYNSPVHTAAMKTFGADPEMLPPLTELPEDFQGPILTIASVTPKKTMPKPGEMPIDQIAIELYAPIPGGAYIGSRFAPKTLEVPGMKTYDEE